MSPTQRLSVEEYRALVAEEEQAEKAHKYHARATTVDGIRFASQAEARRYKELKLLEANGHIGGLVLQPGYILCDNPRVVYVADFSYLEGGKTIVEDVKGFPTPAWRIKEKLFRAKYSELELRIVR